MRDYDQLITLTDPAYQAWLAELQSDMVVDDGVVVLYSKQSIPERNEINEMETFLPNHLTIGSNSGDMVFVLELKKESIIWQVDAGSLRFDDFEEIASSFSAWRDSRFALPREPEYHLPLRADVYVDQVEDLKTMFELKKLLAQNWGASQMKIFLRQQPFLAVRSGQPIALERKLKKNPMLKSYIFYKNAEALEQICS